MCLVIGQAGFKGLADWDVYGRELAPPLLGDFESLTCVFSMMFAGRCMFRATFERPDICTNNRNI